MSTRSRILKKYFPRSSGKLKKFNQNSTSQRGASLNYKYMTQQQKQNKDILIKLIQATTQEEVTHLINTEDFFKNAKWIPYGNQENNAGTIKAQSPDPVGALVEK